MWSFVMSGLSTRWSEGCSSIVAADSGSPDPSVYENQSTLNSLLEEAQTQLSQARATGTADIRISRLRMRIELASKEMDEVKKAKAASA